MYTTVHKYLNWRNIHSCTLGYIHLVNSADTKIHKVDSRHTIYLRKELVEDSLFPFKPEEPLVIDIEKETLIIRRKRK